MSTAPKQPQVQALRDHPPEALEELRQLLASDAPAHPDPQRADFFEIEGKSLVYFVYILPGSRNVVLLATWSREERRPHLARTLHEEKPIPSATESFPN